MGFPEIDSYYLLKKLKNNIYIFLNSNLTIEILDPIKAKKHSEVFKKNQGKNFIRFQKL